MQQQQNRQVQEIRQLIQNTTPIRFRKISLSGSVVQAFTSTSADPIKPKQLVLNYRKDSPRPEPQLNVKLLEDDCYCYKKYKADNGVKSLLKAYDDIRKKKKSECMDKLGLEVMKIKSYSSNAKKAHNLGALRLSHAIHSKKQLKKLDVKQFSNRQMLSPLKNKSSMDSKKYKEDEDIEFQFKNLIELTTSMSHFSQEKNLRHQHSLNASNKNDPNRIIKKESKAGDYLYKRLEGTQKNAREEQNQIYDRRIKSYLEFLWKTLYAHNVFLSLDLKMDEINTRPKKVKAYVTLGNNGAMVRGLIKRRFWWTLVQERTPDCQFVWTQLKVNQIFQTQKKATPRKPQLKDQQWDSEQSFEKKTRPNLQFRMSKLPYPVNQQNNTKIMSSDDAQLYKRYWNKHQRNKERDYAFRLQKNPKELEQIHPESCGPVHNHLEYNFYLGNKKALFYNLREYYGLVGKNIFDFVPLTFHIKKGIKDPEYTRFVEYYKRRAKVMLRQAKGEQQQDNVAKAKTRNIWIVKPGENSNQGRGITVIDQIYQLNSIMKQQAHPPPSSSSPASQPESTHIVQMYLDRPLLYNNRKFDIRHYMLITNFYGVMRAYWYDEGYIRTSAYEFDIDSFQPEIHLTNDAIQKKYEKYGRYEAYNKISYDEFQRYLDGDKGSSSRRLNFREGILPQMREMATDAAKSVFTKISPKNQLNNFQVFGLDFMIDKDFKPWLIEINTNPCLECNSPLQNRIIPYMLEQSFKLSLDLAFPPPTHYPNTCKHYAPLVVLYSFKYQLIFDSQYEGQALTKMYKRIKSNLIEQIGEIQDDEEFQEEGAECKLDDFT